MKKKSQIYPINSYYTPKDASRREESNGMLHDPIQSKESGHLEQKVNRWKFEKIPKNHKKILETSTKRQKMRLDETNRLVYNMYRITT